MRLICDCFYKTSYTFKLFQNKAKKYEMAKTGQKRTLKKKRTICDYFYET